MQPFITVSGVVAPLDRVNVDTDQIIPKQFLKSVVRTGLGKGLFFDWRKDPEFVTNRPRYREAKILVARANFGCGSSREHAPWALADFGFRAVIAPSFADIFRNNSLKNGFLPVILKEAEVEAIFRAIEHHEEAYELTIDLASQTVRDDSGWSAHFEISEFQKQCLLEGLDDVGLTLMREREIAAYEQSHPLPYRL
ncbi:MAG TPA: 3-isopropylmalate dehydratase small subunit [Candidatus Binataceae bacterium]|nr:3-isopropylmalate dehydratase small subunit [Candidatus Binataceae bacterium]